MPDLLSDVEAFPHRALLSERVHRILGLNPSAFTGPGTNTYLVGAGGSDPVLIDTGSGLSAYLELFAEHLRETGARPPRRCILTHVHPDHIGGAAGLRARYEGLTVHKHPWPEKDRQFDVPLEHLGDGDVVRGDGYTLRAVHTPGHALDHLCFYLEEERALFTGDLILGVGTTVIPQDGGDLADYLDSLRALQGLEIDRIYPGHGPVIDEPQAKIAAYLEHRLQREQQVLAQLDGEPRTVPEIVGVIYQSYPQHLHQAAGSSVMSHLVKLEREGRVFRDGGDPPRFRRAAATAQTGRPA